MQGLNTQFNVWQMSQASDDEVGGAVFTGTITDNCIQGHLRVNTPSQLLIEQGLETKITADAFVLPGTVVLEERYVLEVSGPINHPNLNQRFRIVGVADWSKHPQDQTKFHRLKLIRIERTRTETKI